MFTSHRQKQKQPVRLSIIALLLNILFSTQAISAPPRAITLVYFEAHAQADSVFLEWETGSEYDHSGFDLYRSQSGGERGELIADFAARGDLAGAYYDYTDTAVQPGITYFYTLISIDIYGNENNEGSKSATPGQTPTASPTVPSSATPTPTGTTTPTATSAPTATPEPTATSVPQPANTPANPAGPAYLTATPAPSPSATPEPTATPAPSPAEPPAATPTPQPTATAIPPTATPVPATDTPPPPTVLPDSPLPTPEPTAAFTAVLAAATSTSLAGNDPRAGTALPIRPPAPTRRPGPDDPVRGPSKLLAIIAIGSLLAALILSGSILLLWLRWRRSNSA